MRRILRIQTGWGESEGSGWRWGRGGRDRQLPLGPSPHGQAATSSQILRHQRARRHLVELINILCQLAEILKDHLKALKVVKTPLECPHPKLLWICKSTIAAWL